MYKYLLILFLPICAFSQNPKNHNYELVGRFSGFNDGTKFFLSTLGKGNQSDSAVLDRGIVRFKGFIKEPTVFRLQTRTGEYVALWLEQGLLEMKGSQKEFDQAFVSNSKINRQNKQIGDQFDPLYNKYNELYQLYENEKDENLKEKLLKRARRLDDSTTMLRIENIFSAEPSYPLMQEVFYMRNEIPKDSLQLAFNRFPKYIQEGANGKLIKEVLSSSIIMVGMIAPEVEGKNLKDELVKLSDFKGKIVLLDFWAAWCGPCRESNKQLQKLYANYKDQGFEIFSFSIDTNQKAWIKASEVDGITWSNVSDLEGHFSPNAIRYAVQGIPKAFIIDRKGVIREIILGYSEKNHEKILGYINNDK